MSSDRTLPATPRRREQALRRGLLPTCDGVAWIAATIVLTACLPLWLRSVTATTAEHFGRMPAYLGDPQLPLGPLVTRLAWQLVWPTLLTLGVATAAGVGVRLIADRPRLVPGRLAAFERISPANGLRRLTSRETAQQIFLGMLATVILLATLRWSFSDLAVHLQEAILDPRDDGRVSLWLAWRGLWGVVVVAGVLALAQQWLRWRASERRLRMTPEELREEQRLLEANPQVRLPTRETPDLQKPSVSQQSQQP